MSDEIVSNKVEMDTHEHLQSESEQPSTDGLTGPVVLILVAILGAGFLLRTQHLSTISFCFHEACSWRISQFPISERLDAISRDAHPPLYYFVLNGWMAVFGNGVVAARSLSIFFGLLTVLAAWWFTRIAIGHLQNETGNQEKGLDYEIVPILAAALVAISPLQIEMSHFARPYTIGTFLALLSGVCALRAVREPSIVINWAYFALATSALSMTHYYGLWTLAAFMFFIVLEAIISLARSGWVARTKQLLTGAILSAWGIQMIWLPWMSTFFFQRNRTDGQLWMPPFSFNGFNSTMWRIITGGNYSELWPDYTWIAPVLFLLVGISLLISRSPAKRLAAFALLIPPIAVVVYGLSIRNIIGVRYLIFAHVFFLIGLILLLGRGKLLYLRWVCLLLVFSWSSYWAYQYSEHRDYLASFPGVKTAVLYLNKNRVSNEPVICSSPFVLTIALKYIDQSESMYTKYYGNHRSNILSGPSLKLSDYENVPGLLKSQPETLWTVDAIGLFGGIHTVDVSSEYVLISEERFPERFSFRMDLIVKKYHLK